MSAAGRLWRRAPAWRICLVTAIVATALAAMFPPAIPRWARYFAARTDSAALPKATTPARFVPQTQPAIPNYTSLEVPPPGPGRSGVIPFAGHQLPLPDGAWQTQIIAHGGKPVPGTVEALARIEAGNLTGLVLVGSQDPLANIQSPFNATQECDERDTIASWIAPEPFGQNSLVHECWRLAALRGFDLAERGRADPVLDRALLRLKLGDTKLPEKLVLLDYLRSEPGGFMSVLLFLPDKRGPSDQRLLAWVKRYVTALHDGFSGTLSPKLSVRDPE